MTAFDVNVASIAITGLDVLIQAGGPNRALVKDVAVTVTSGSLTITFTRRVNFPEINGIEILLPPPAVVVPHPVDCGASAGTVDSAGNRWLADEGFTGGAIAERPGTLPIANTSDPFIYRTERYDVSFPEINGIEILPPEVQPPPVRWQFAGWHGGGCFPDGFFDPNNRDRIVFGSDVAGAWRSNDHGERWEFITKN